MKVIVGLGNPGRGYEETRHNIGWMVLDRLVERAGWDGRVKAKDAAATVWGRYRGLDVAFVKPLTYMNLSGVAVRKVLARFHVPLEEMLVVIDDFALPFGRLRFREGGGAGGHNGLRSIIEELDNDRFARLRVGIGAPGDDATDHVLSRFRADERRALGRLLDAAADAVETWAHEGTPRAANRWNTWSLEADAATAGGAAAGPGPSAEAAADPIDRSVTVDPADGGLIRRTATGWRKLLPRDRDPG